MCGVFARPILPPDNGSPAPDCCPYAVWGGKVDQPDIIREGGLDVAPLSLCESGIFCFGVKVLKVYLCKTKFLGVTDLVANSILTSSSADSV